MKGLSCPSLCPAHFWQLGFCHMAEDSRAQAQGKGPPLSVQLLRAQYADLRQQQRAQAHFVVLPKGGSTPGPAESMVSAVWINKERRRSLAQDELDPAAAGTLEAAEGGCVQVPRSPWHTHLQMRCTVLAFHQEASHQVTGSEHRPPQERDPGLDNKQTTEQEATVPEAAPRGCQVSSPQAKTAGSGLNNGTGGPSSRRNPPRPGKPAHYPFPQRKAPRISQAARSLGLYGPP